MNTYLFVPSTTMKPYNLKRYWVDKCIIPTVRITATTLESALEKFSETTKKHGITISNNAMRVKQTMFEDDPTTGEPRQVGYVITGAMDVHEGAKCTMQYVDIWLRIDMITSVF